MDLAASKRLIGERLDAIDTPALIVDADRLDANLQQMARYFDDRACRLRPHFKSHKCVELARRQLAAGNATGITCAKLSEAAHLVAGGIDDVLVANQVVGPRKARRLAELNRKATVRCAVESVENVAELGRAAVEAGQTIPVLVEVDVGMHRCGVPTGGPALKLARQVADTDGLRFDGLQGYEGHLINTPDPEQRRQRTLDSMQPLVDTRRQLEAAGLPVALVSGGSSATFDITGNLDGIDEIQCGTYAMMDLWYRRIRPEFDIARWVLCTVISSRPGETVVDLGLKGIGCDFGPPQVEGHREAQARYTAEEHIPFDNLTVPVGERLCLIPGHGCTTHHLYRRMWVFRGDRIVDVWEIEGAGALA